MNYKNITILVFTIILILIFILFFYIPKQKNKRSFLTNSQNIEWVNFIHKYGKLSDRLKGNELKCSKKLKKFTKNGYKIDK